MKGQMLVLIVIVGSCLLFLLTPAGADTVVVDDDAGDWVDYITIQDAIDNVTIDGTAEVLVYNGTYDEDVLLDRPISVTGNGTDQVLVVGSGTDNAFEVTSGDANVTGLSITGADGFDQAGLYSNRAENCTFTDLNVSGNEVGVFIGHSHNATLENVRGNGNDLRGIWISYSSDVRLERCNGSWNEYDGIYIYYCDRVNVSNSSAHRNNAADSAADGISVVNSENCTLYRNVASNGLQSGINVQYSPNTTVLENGVHDNGEGEGLQIIWSVDCVVIGNNVSGNPSVGIDLNHADDTIIANNTIARNAEGVNATNSDKITIIYNEILNNTYRGVSFPSGVSNSVVHHNNFRGNNDNDSQAYDAGSNWWDDGAEGNWWSDWNGTGSYSVDGSGREDEHPLGDPIETGAPEKVPEFGLLYVVSTIFLIAIFIRRRR